MEKLIACCGLDCAACDARIATVTNDDKLRAQIAEKWKVEYNVPGITANSINCTGCREEGVKIGHCLECQIRNCAIANNYKTCADCAKMDSCELLKQVFQFTPDALQNLKSMN
ncbi:MAG: DUF3795 domain-containing protein [Bacteroidota bacterium]